jgi:hypothetical protein
MQNRMAAIPFFLSVRLSGPELDWSLTYPPRNIPKSRTANTVRLIAT